MWGVEAGGGRSKVGRGKAGRGKAGRGKVERGKVERGKVGRGTVGKQEDWCSLPSSLSHHHYHRNCSTERSTARRV